MDTYQQNYRRLVKLGVYIEGDAPQRNYARSTSGGYMDLIVERVPYMDNSDGIAFSLAHYFEQNGDLCKDPEMVVRVYPKWKMAEALTYEQSMPPVYQVVYPEPDQVRPVAKRKLNQFLSMWARNLINQGHGKTWHNTTMNGSLIA